MADKRTIPGTETIGFTKPTRTMGLETLARVHTGQDSTFAHAVIAYNPDMTPEEIAAKEMELIERMKISVYHTKPFTISLKGNKTEYPLSKLIPWWKFPAFVKLSNLQFEATPYNGMYMEANEFVVRLDDRRYTPHQELRSIIGTTNTGERVPFNMDFSVPREQFKQIFIVIVRTKLSMDRKFAWGFMDCNATLTFSNKPKQSAITPVVGKTLLAANALDKHIFDPTRQDNRLSQAGLVALGGIGGTIKNETTVNRGAVLAKRTTGTLRHEQKMRGYTDDENDADSFLDIGDDPVARAAMYREAEEKENEERRIRASFGTRQVLSSIREVKDERTSWIEQGSVRSREGTVLSKRESVQGVVQVVENPPVNPYTVLSRDEAPGPGETLFPQNAAAGPSTIKRAPSVSSVRSRYSANNPFVTRGIVKNVVEPVSEEVEPEEVAKGKKRVAFDQGYFPEVVRGLP